MARLEGYECELHGGGAAKLGEIKIAQISCAMDDANDHNHAIANLI